MPSSSRTRRARDDAPQNRSGGRSYDPSRLYKMLETACLDLPTPAEVSYYKLYLMEFILYYMFDFDLA